MDNVGDEITPDNFFVHVIYRVRAECWWSIYLFSYIFEISLRPRKGITYDATQKWCKRFVENKQDRQIAVNMNRKHRQGDYSQKHHNALKMSNCTNNRCRDHDKVETATRKINVAGRYVQQDHLWTMLRSGTPQLCGEGGSNLSLTVENKWFRNHESSRSRDKYAERMTKVERVVIMTSSTRSHGLIHRREESMWSSARVNE